MASDINRFAAECTRHWPSRFGYFASLPLPDVSAAIAEAISALGQHGAAGVTMLSNHAGLYQGDPQLDPLYEELDKRRAVAFIHPAVFTAGRYPTQPSDGSPVPGIQPARPAPPPGHRQRQPPGRTRWNAACHCRSAR